MGTVYKAVDPLIERTVAIKTINLNLSKEERAEFEERFYREAKSAGRLSHANIVTIYDVGEIDDIAYIAMEYLEGESLREMLDSGVVLPMDMIGKIAARVASALSYAHENQVVHRDIKPANIMITSSRDVKIMDFGIAQISTASRTQLGTVLGSPKYMAPEQVAGQATDGKTDIFALGVVLYEMLTGTTPFNGDNLSAIMYKILHEDPAPPSALNPRVPAVFDRIVSRALAKRPADRYATAREFALDLKSQNGGPAGGAHAADPGPKAEKTAQAAKASAGQQDATIFLPPHKARDVIAAVPPRAGAGFKGKMLSLMQGAQLSGKPLLMVIPLLAIVAVVIYFQSAPSDVDAPPAAAPSSVDEGVTIIPPLLTAVPETGTASPADVAEADAPSLRAIPSTQGPMAPAGGAASERAPEPEPAAQAAATLSFAISPWGEVFVDGKSVGVAPPLTTLQLEPGSHQVEIRNQAFAPYRDTVKLKPGQSIKIRYKFR